MVGGSRQRPARRSGSGPSIRVGPPRTSGQLSASARAALTTVDRVRDPAHSRQTLLPRRTTVTASGFVRCRGRVHHGVVEPGDTVQPSTARFGPPIRLNHPREFFPQGFWSGWFLRRIRQLPSDKKGGTSMRQHIHQPKKGLDHASRYRRLRPADPDPRASPRRGPTEEQGTPHGAGTSDRREHPRGRGRLRPHPLRRTLRPRSMSSRDCGPDGSR